MRNFTLFTFMIIIAMQASCNKPTESYDPGIYNKYKLCIYDIESEKLETVHDFGTLEYDYRPEFALFSPDGSKIVYYRQYQLHCINVDSSDKTVLSGDLRADRDFPTTSDDGVYFSAYNGELRDIYFTPWNEIIPENITNSDSLDERHPYVHESGSKMLYVADRDTMSMMIEINLLNNCDTLLFVNAEYFVNYPAYSPIDSRLFFFNGNYMTVIDVVTLDTITLLTKSHGTWTGQLSFNITYQYLAFSAGEGNVANYQTLEILELPVPHFSTIYPCLSHSNSLISYSCGSIFLFDYVLANLLKEISGGYYSRFSPNESQLLVFIKK